MCLPCMFMFSRLRIRYKKTINGMCGKLSYFPSLQHFLNASGLWERVVVHKWFDVACHPVSCTVFWLNALRSDSIGVPFLVYPRLHYLNAQQDGELHRVTVSIYMCFSFGFFPSSFGRRQTRVRDDVIQLATTGISRTVGWIAVKKIIVNMHHAVCLLCLAALLFEA